MYNTVLSQTEITDGSVTADRVCTYKTENCTTMSLCNGTQEALLAELFIDGADTEFYSGEHGNEILTILLDAERMETSFEGVGAISIFSMDEENKEMQ